MNNEIKKLQELKKKIAAFALAAGMTTSALPGVVSAEKNDALTPTTMSLADINAKKSTTLNDLKQFEQLTSNLSKELISKNIESESGRSFTKADLYPYVYLQNMDFITDDLKNTLINKGYIATEIEKTIVAALSVEDAIKGHNITLAFLNGKTTELHFGLEKVGNKNKKMVNKEKETLYYNKIQAFNDTPFLKNRTTYKLMDLYKNNLDKYSKDFNAYRAAHPEYEDETVIEYYNKKEDKKALQNLEKSIKIKAVGVKEYTEKDFVNISVSVYDETAKKVTNQAFKKYVAVSKDNDLLRPTIESYLKDYNTSKVLDTYGVGADYSVNLYTKTLFELVDSNDFYTNYAYSLAKSNSDYKKFRKTVEEYGDYANDVSAQVIEFKNKSYTFR